MSKSPSLDLFQLVKSMTQSEKRYFKIFASRHTIGEKNNYIKLFDAIEKQKNYDETKLRDTQKYISQFAVIKKGLYDLVLRSLDSYNFNSSVEAELKNNSHYIEVLYKKGLYDQCDRIIEKSKQLALKYEKHLLMLDLYEWEIRLIVARNYLTTTKEQAAELHKNILTQLENHHNYNEYKHVSLLWYIKMKQVGTVRSEGVMKEVKEIVNTPLLKDKKNARSFQALYSFYHVNMGYSSSMGNLEKSFSYVLEMVSHMEKPPHQIAEFPEQYKIALFNLINSYLTMGKFKEAFEAIAKLKNIPTRSEVLKKELLYNEIFYEMAIYAMSVDFEKGVKKLNQVSDIINSHDLEVSIAHDKWMMIHYQAALLYFGAGHFKLALKHLNKIVNMPNIDYRNDMVCFARILMLIVHYELGNTDLMEYSVKSVYRFLVSRNSLHRFEGALLQFVRRMQRLDTDEKIRSAFKKLKSELEEIIETPTEREAMEYFDFISWLESKIHNTDYAALVRKRLKSAVN